MDISDPKCYLGQDVEVKIDRPLGTTHHKYGWAYQVNYGFVPETKASDGEELDVYILGVNEPLEKYTGKCIAIIHRINNDDDKLIIVPPSMTGMTDEQIRHETDFQEKYFESKILRGV